MARKRAAPKGVSNSRPCIAFTSFSVSADPAAHKRFAEAYQQRYKDYPRLGSVVGYSTIKALAAGLKAAGSADTEKLVNAMQGLEFETPFGAARFR
ncbi:MAG: hypothetical protein EBX71_11200, partial [Betaproteobacteria bacterium]|nr:hypothetical protein [Betaproteobacteria bacterium]